MKTYLVGGAVRDELLKLPVKEWDWVVVGSTPEEMAAQGYKAVGKDFPVFLHPKTHDEYALARTERKTGPGYKGFEFHADADVTLEQDLQRRDFTVNAMAEDTEGNIIDPCGGRTDLAKGVLRHVSDAFVEDPVRVLRAARFMAKFAHLGFTVADETMELMRNIAVSGELDHLVPERVWAELQKALNERHPAEFFATLNEAGALKKIFPEISQAFDDENMQSLQKAVLTTQDPKVRFAALMQFLPADLVQHRCEHFHIPNEFTELAVACATFREAYHNLPSATAEEILAILDGTDVWRRPERFENFNVACAANVKLKHADEISERLCAALVAAKQIQAKTFVEQGLEGQALGDALKAARVEAIAATPATV
tara:strand:- start:40004 stop:41113 length:1110 start_codon:yes stop_codon:yes gene_type:complete